MYEQDSEIK